MTARDGFHDTCAALETHVRQTRRALVQARRLADCPIGMLRKLADSREVWNEMARAWRGMGHVKCTMGNGAKGNATDKAHG